MSLTKQEFTQFIRQFDFKNLFLEMGWNRDRSPQASVAVGTETFRLDAVAEKGGFRVMVCQPGADGQIPDYATRRQIDQRVTKLVQEHLLIYVDRAKREQLWQVPVRRAGQPPRYVETRWNTSQAPELLFQRAAGLFIAIDEEGNLTIVDITRRVAANFEQNAERVTKRFYDGFKREHKAFLEFISGIETLVDREWYASLMLNRLMFCYFIQKKGFLDNDRAYLRNRLNQSKDKRGTNQFYTFYRSFLLLLFHRGLGAPDRSDPKLLAEIGRVPYLNGGFFSEHELEEQYPDIQIDDSAFERIFAFFDEWNWHLDDRSTADGRQINPDVIGYIFERYINDRAGMGAYYTKEDITDYIGKNCLIPYLFDDTARRYPAAFAATFANIPNSGDTYVYPAVRRGLSLPVMALTGHDWQRKATEVVAGGLPDEVAVGLDTTQPHLLDRRKAWNRPAPGEIALPTEIYRELIARRQRYADLRARIDQGRITSIQDFITHNLDIRLFAQDALETTTDPKLILHFYEALRTVSVLDPTCGSGAFLFAALNILEPLYETCLLRMRTFVEEEDRLNQQDRQTFRNSFDKFRAILSEVQAPQHPNLRYFIYKSIILNNLYGVDIMREAVEIAKLRLFLKLVATVDADYDKDNLGLEPLPDVDFNIRAGNTLVGFATEAELDRGLTYTIEGSIAKPGIEEKMELVAMAHERYKTLQLDGDDEYASFREAKLDLRQRLTALNDSLNRLLHKQYSAQKFEVWLPNYKPFHWFAEFYEIVKERGGFDVIIGNPPYVDLDDIYRNNKYQTQPCGDLYALCVERTISQILSKRGVIGMIVPISIASTDGYSSLREICLRSKFSFFFANFGVRPAKLFDGVDKRLTIFISSQLKKHYSTKYYRWNAEERSAIFQSLTYAKCSFDSLRISGLPKISSSIEMSILGKLALKADIVANYVTRSSSNQVKYTRKLQYFIQFFENPPKIYDENKKIIIPSELKILCFNKSPHHVIANATLNSNLFFWFFIVFSDCRNVNSREILKFPIAIAGFTKEQIEILSKLKEELLENLESNSIFQVRNDRRAGLLQIQSFRPRLSKSILDQIDKVLAEHYGFTEEELDFIINYDIKYRMGRGAGEDEED